MNTIIIKYKQDSIYFVDIKQTLVLKKRTDDCLELEHTERGILYYLKPYKERSKNKVNVLRHLFGLKISKK
ncbi:MAG: hypothetical protein ACI976_000635 [Aureispira sp.]